MGIKELDLEFERETNGASKNDDALDVNVDLSFSANNQAEKKPAREVRAMPVPILKDAPRPENKVRNIQEARPSTPAPNAAMAELKSEINNLKAEMQLIKQTNDVALAVSEAEKEYLIEYISNAKLLDHQVTQMLVSIHKKVPALAGEVQGIKKVLQEFLQKSKPTKK